ncbi:hypothetical protein ACIRSF_00685 [Streptomyces rubiginosohelvolus]|uniref:hypothetical protein n=1 Tax=Streptomyces rubiginosohelvolus TaxID=67362 RepID=UPI0038037F4E
MQPSRPSGRACTADDRRGAGRETGLHRQTEQVLASSGGLPDALTASRPLAGTISQRILNETVKAGRVDRETGSLRTVQQILWHLADRNADALAALQTEDDDGSIARDWIKTYATDAQGQVTADFEDGGKWYSTSPSLAAPRRSPSASITKAGE